MVQGTNIPVGRWQLITVLKNPREKRLRSSHIYIYILKWQDKVYMEVPKFP